MALASRCAPERPSDAPQPPAQVLAHPSPEVLFSEHEELVESIVSRHVSRLRATSLERGDLLQEARIALWNAATRFDSQRGAQFATFASHAITGALLHALRAARRPEITDLSQADFETSPSPESQVEARVTLQQLFAHLSSRDCTAVQMHFLYGYSAPYVAHQLGLSERHTRRILDDAMSQLQVLAAL